MAEVDGEDELNYCGEEIWTYYYFIDTTARTTN